MRIKLLINLGKEFPEAWADPEHPWMEGEVHDAKDTTAAKLIRRGHAVAVEEDAPKAKEIAPAGRLAQEPSRSPGEDSIKPLLPPESVKEMATEDEAAKAADKAVPARTPKQK